MTYADADERFDCDYEEKVRAVYAPGAGPLSMRLRTKGNPDFGQYAPVSNPVDIRAMTVEELIGRVKAYRDFWQFGMGNWPQPPVKNWSGQTIGTISIGLRFLPAHGLDGHIPMFCRRKACNKA